MSRRSLDWYEDQLEFNTNLSPAKIIEYEAEIEIILEEERLSKQKYKDAQQLKEEERRKILENIISLKEQGRMQQLIDDYGQQFIGDYSITEKFEVISFAFNERNPNQQKVWQCACHESAVKKLHMLLYYRVYDHYCRDSQ